MRADFPRVALLTLALLGLILQGGSLAHQHQQSQPGLFNYDHDLSTLATVGGGLVPAPPDLVPGLIALTLPPSATVAVPGLAPRRHAYPRAPPPVEPPPSS
jgi:hypothetical protein